MWQNKKYDHSPLAKEIGVQCLGQGASGAGLPTRCVLVDIVSVYFSGVYERIKFGVSFGSSLFSHWCCDGVYDGDVTFFAYSHVDSYRCKRREMFLAAIYGTRKTAGRLG